MLRRLRPLPHAMRGNACAWCDRRQSVWELVSRKGPETVCSLCLLYHEEVWTKEIEQIITQVEVARGCMFDRDARARLTRCEDADRVMGVVVLTDRVTGVRERSSKLLGRP